MSNLTENNYKKFEIEFQSDIGEDYFKIDGVSNLEMVNHTVRFLYKGNINTVIKKIAGLEISNVWIDEPTLEEIFMHYYAKEG
jgi:ABC-2 type transport system ATP-binding protein